MIRGAADIVFLCDRGGNRGLALPGPWQRRLRLEQAVRINAVAPGWIASRGLDHYGPEMRARIRGLHRHVPLGRLGTESEVSAAIVFLLSPAAAFVSGSCLRVDAAVPNARRSSPLPGRGANQAFNAFLLAQTPKVLDEDG